MALIDHTNQFLSKEEKALIKKRIFEKIAVKNRPSLYERLKKNWMLLLYVLAITAALTLMIVKTSHQKTKHNITVKNK